jgi:serine/threonine-protein kinase
MMEKYGRYELVEPIASGGMGTVYLGRAKGAGGFVSVVAIKRLNPSYSGDARFRQMLIDEARLTGQVRDPHVVATIDLVEDGGELLLVMEYAHGLPLSSIMEILRAHGARMPLPVVVKVIVDVLSGLEAAHAARGDRGDPLQIVHRDVSPQNIIMGFDGLARVVDFGIAYASERHERTRTGELKGKLGYLAPEQFDNDHVDRRVDIFASGVVLWELVTGRRARPPGEAADALKAAILAEFPPLDAFAPQVSPVLRDVISKALAHDRTARYSHAKLMASELCAAVAPASALFAGEWLRDVAADEFERKQEALERVRRSTHTSDRPTHPDGAVLSESKSPPNERGVSSVRVKLGSSAIGRTAIVLLGLVGAAAIGFLGARNRHPNAMAHSEASQIEAQLPPPSSVIPIASSADAVFEVTAPVQETEKPKAMAGGPKTVHWRPVPSAANSGNPAPSRSGTSSSPEPSGDARSCATPYTINAQGLRIPRTECY